MASFESWDSLEHAIVQKIFVHSGGGDFSSRT